MPIGAGIDDRLSGDTVIRDSKVCAGQCETGRSTGRSTAAAT